MHNLKRSNVALQDQYLREVPIHVLFEILCVFWIRLIEPHKNLANLKSLE
jgi:hypothetical protein